jgi:hypothetical protein
MADIGNYTMNFCYGRPAGLTFAALTLACAEIHRETAGTTDSKEI